VQTTTFASNGPSVTPGPDGRVVVEIAFADESIAVRAHSVAAEILDLTDHHQSDDRA
jgi:hypothetical protein